MSFKCHKKQFLILSGAVFLMEIVLIFLQKEKSLQPQNCKDFFGVNDNIL